MKKAFFSLWLVSMSFCVWADEFPLTVIADPPESRIRIMNIRPIYRPGILLKPDRYDIEVSHAGYTNVRQWVKIVNQAVTVQISLKKSGNNLITPGAPLIKPDEIQKWIKQLSGWKRLGTASRQFKQLSYKRNEAIRQLVIIGTPAVEPLIVTLKDCGMVQLRSTGFFIDILDRKYVCQAVAETLGKIGDNRAVEPLIAAVKNNGRDVREAAAKALGKIGDKKAVKPLTIVLKDSDDSMRGVAAEALVKIGQSAVDPLIVVLGDSDWQARRAAAEALGKIGDKKAVKPLIAALKDSDKNVREAAAEALEKFGWQPPFPLTIITDPPDSRIRIMNIRPKYQPGILLAPGTYEIEVSHAGYKAIRNKVVIYNQAISLVVLLKKQKPTDLMERTDNPCIMSKDKYDALSTLSTDELISEVRSNELKLAEECSYSGYTLSASRGCYYNGIYYNEYKNETFCILGTRKNRQTVNSLIESPPESRKRQYIREC